MEDKLYNILEKFVINNNIKINPEDFKLQLQSNPSFPNIKSISDTLDYFGIDNIVANVPKDALEQLPECFLAVMETDTSKNLTQVLRKKNNIKLFKDDGSKETVSVSDFKTMWNGTIIAVEKSTEEINKQRNYFKNPITLLSVLTIIIISFSLFSLEPQAIAYTVFAIIGCYISYFIIRESLGLENKSTSKICNSAANNTSCNDVINAKNSKIFNLVSLSDASITFFTSIVLTIFFFGFNPSFFLGLSALSVPIIVYTIYSQAFILKKWCPLCLGVSGILIAQLVTSLLFINPLDFDVSYITKSILLAVAIYLIWLSVKELILKAKDKEQIQTDFLKFKRNENLFNTLLHKEKLSSTVNISSENSISFGNLNAPLEITSITNPLCGYCTKAFEGYDTLLKTYGDKIRLNIIFNVPSENIEQPATQISQKIISLYMVNPSEAYKALKNWFKIKDVDTWQLEYGIPNKDASLKILQQHTNWCDNKGINYTPATLIGDYFFPKEYEIKDLSLFIDSLTEQKKETNKIKEPIVP